MPMERCLGCMNEFDASFDVCPHCGYIKGSPAKSRNHLEPGTMIIDRYMIGRCLGQGGFGITYIAWDTRLYKKVAIKEFMPNSLASRITGQTDITCYNEEAQARFQNGIRRMLDESRRLARFNDLESVVKVYDCFEANCTAYIIMELLEGENIKVILEEKGAMDLPQIGRIMTPVLLALREIHASGLIHRDISPDNIFLCSNGKVKLLDFGSARVASGEDDKSLSVILKPGYAPKEQYSGSAKQGPYTDVYAVCATIYKMLTGVTPIDSLDRKVQKDTLQPIESLVQIPHAVAEVITEGMAVEAKDRLQTVDPLLEVFGQMDGESPPVVPRKTHVVRRKKSPWKKILIVGAAILVLGAAAFFISKYAGKRAGGETTTDPVSEIATDADPAASDVTYSPEQTELLRIATLETLPVDSLPQPQARVQIEQERKDSRVYSAADGLLYAEYRDDVGRLLLREQIDLPDQSVVSYTLYSYVDDERDLPQDEITYICADVPEDESGDADGADDAVHSAVRYFYNKDDDSLFTKSYYEGDALARREEYPTYNLDGDPVEMTVWVGGEQTAHAAIYYEDGVIRTEQKDMHDRPTMQCIERLPDAGKDVTQYASDGAVVSRESWTKTDGRLTKYTRVKYNHTERRLEWTYRDGLLIGHRAYGNDDEPEATITFGYDADGNVQSITCSNPDGEIRWNADHSYTQSQYTDDDRTEMEEVEYDADRDPIRRKIISFDDKHRKKSEEIRDDDSNALQKTLTYEYTSDGYSCTEKNADGRKTKVEYFSSEDLPTRTVLYDERSHVTDDRRFDADGKTETQRIQREYDGGDLTEIAVYADGEQLGRAVYTYRSGNWEKQTFYGEDNDSPLKWIEYKVGRDFYYADGKLQSSKAHSSRITELKDMIDLTGIEGI